MLRLPTRLFTFFASGAIDDLVAERLTVLRAEALEVILHPADLVISGKEEDVIHARAAIAEQLGFSKAHLTWTKESNELEDRLSALWRWLQERRDQDHWARGSSELRAIDQELGRLKAPFEEWEVLFRARLMVERELLREMIGVRGGPLELTNGYRGKFGARRITGNPTEGEMKMAKDNIIGLITGASAGVIAGLLLAPKRGQEARQMVQSQASVLKERARRYATELRHRMGRRGQSGDSSGDGGQPPV